MRYRKTRTYHDRIQRYPTGDDLRLSPELRLCAKFDPVSIATFEEAKKMAPGVRVVDNCTEEHIM